MQSFSPQQRSKLLANRNVQEASEKSVSFTSAFKIKAVHLYLDGVPAEQIFIDAGIPMNFFKNDYCRLCLKRWVHKFKTQGEESLKNDSRGLSATGRPKKEQLKDLSYDELLALLEIHEEALEEVKKQNALERKKRR